MYKFFKILIILFLTFFSNSQTAISKESKIKIGLLVPITGQDKEIGKQIIKSTTIAIPLISSKPRL